MKYSSVNHNWDVTVMASSRLMMLGRATTHNKDSFSSFTGAMLLAVTGLESFLNSIGYAIAISDPEFSFDEFDQKAFEQKLDLIINKFNVPLNKDQRPYQTIKRAIRWRNSIAHSKPTFVEETEIESTDNIRELPIQYIATKNKYSPYENDVSEQNADRFNRDIIQAIDAIKKSSGIDPRAGSTYNR